jgi:hypothetical protein
LLGFPTPRETRRGSYRITLISLFSPLFVVRRTYARTVT